MINIGQYIETLINWMMIHFSTFFDALNLGIGSFINGFQHILFGIPFYLTIAAMVLLAWAKAGRGVAVFTLLGLLLIYGMGFWEATMQTLALVLSSTCLALIVGVPIGVWTANSNRAEKVIHPILDLMQTMPAFVYLIPAVLFFTLFFSDSDVVSFCSFSVDSVADSVVSTALSVSAETSISLSVLKLPSERFLISAVTFSGS